MKPGAPESYKDRYTRLKEIGVSDSTLAAIKRRLAADDEVEDPENNELLEPRGEGD